MEQPLLKVENIEISRLKADRAKPLVRDVSFELYEGEMVALTGPSGCGKSITAHALAGMLEKSCMVTNGRIYYKGQSIMCNDEAGWQQLRGREIALLIQHSLNGLDPIRTVKKQMVETLNQTKKRSKKEAAACLHSLLTQVGFTEPEAILSAYPFELSGGMRQRVLLAMMLSLEPKLLIADEPTTALDVINREKVLRLFKKLQAELGLTILLISHDHNSVSRFADRVVQMKEGELVHT
ncbi:ABC transporter ATP-binding protein [Domibacillus sp. DTU_2020_1001157_1_SI_ALB_TIR_016]|uniref:ABC transporter ATP-binding protein n=1 Tax=Domibacillus sp. DTU_2020_1001157_1_SI_ALB_TIR_016 TaxID=3077789 RepID=UPI0028E23FD8|nr:ABC transporter ATP-binding protein [Domibacillus sp. DTU_2020_1001157_1_SI_ALB_TIR_016]WNS78302.1 ABC transporter ATP-binding protein [Domibacillus sp. DTU_2020_1001157_1_SI_ALB_TIR_016]